MMTKLLHIGFNQDYTCIACGTDSGFRVFNNNPLTKIFDRNINPKTGIKIIEMLFRCNIVAIVGDGTNFKFPTNKVILWDDHTMKIVGELSFRSDIKAIKIRRDRIVVVLTKNIYVYQLNNLSLLDHQETVDNPRGLCSLCPDSFNIVMACPGLQKGYVQLKIYDSEKTHLIAAHQSELGCLTLSFNGVKLATASEKGTVIRIFDTRSGTLLQELQRGHDYATIYSLAFHPNMKFLACSSDKKTIHIFRLLTIEESSSQTEVKSDNDQSTILTFLKPWLPQCKWLEKQWSICQFRIQSSYSIVGFDKESYAIIVVCMDGNVFKARFEENKNDCIEEFSENLCTY